MIVETLTETALIDRILSARTQDTYTDIDHYLSEHSDMITMRIRQALEAYELFRTMLDT